MPPIARPRALVADDEPALRSLFTIYLDAGYAVTAVADGAAALALLADPGWAVAVLDCDMPVMSGPDALGLRGPPGVPSPSCSSAARGARRSTP